MARTVVDVDVHVEEEQVSRDIMQIPSSSSSRQVVQAGDLAVRLGEPAEEEEEEEEEAVRSRRTAVPMRMSLKLETRV